MTHSLRQRKLGQHLTVSAIGYGAMGMSEFYGAAETAHAQKILHQVIDCGVTLIDTADMYGHGENEKLIGSVLKTLSDSTRAQLTIATKCGIDRSHTAGYSRNINNRPEYIKQSVIILWSDWVLSKLIYFIFTALIRIRRLRIRCRLWLSWYRPARLPILVYVRFPLRFCSVPVLFIRLMWCRLNIRCGDVILKMNYCLC